MKIKNIILFLFLFLLLLLGLSFCKKDHDIPTGVNYNADSLIIQVSANPSNGGFVSGGGVYQNGQLCTVKAIATNGFSFLYWTEDDNQVSMEANYPFTVTNNRTLVAHFTEIPPMGTVYTISEILAMESGTVFTEDAYVYGIITADEQSGNLYKCAYMQDRISGAALELSLNSVTGVRIGDSVRIDLKGVTYSLYNNMPQLCDFNSDGHITILANNKPIEPTLTNIANINAGQHLAGLVRLENVQFIEQNTFSEPNNYGNRILVDANNINQTILVRTSNYANFAADSLPKGIGDLIAVTSVYNDTRYLHIRSADELVFDSGGNNNEYYTITAVPNPPHGGVVYGVDNGSHSFQLGETCVLIAEAYDEYLFANWTEHGNIVSTEANYSFSIIGSRDLVAQFQLKNYTINVSTYPTNAGIVSGGGTYQYGQSCTLTSVANEGYIFIGWLEDGNVVSTDANYAFVVNRERTLVASFVLGDGNGTFEDPYNVASGIALQSEEPIAWVHGYIVGAVKSGLSSVTSNADINWSAPFDLATNVVIADDASCNEISQCIIVNLPAGKPLRTQVNLMDNPDNLGKHLAVTGKLRKYFNQPGLRDSGGTEADFVLDGNITPPPTPGTTIFSETFASGQGEFTIQNILLPQELPYVWQHDANYSCMKAIAYVNQAYAAESWLISPVIDLSNASAATLKFDQSVNHASPDGALTVMISTDYDGNVFQSTWTELSLSQWPPGNNWTFINSTADLNQYLGQRVTIAFKYTSNFNASATWEVNNIVVEY